MKELNDDELVRRAVEDDRKAFAELVDRHKNGVFALLRRLLGRIDEVEDIAQNVFLAAYRGLPAFKGRAKFGTWIYRIAYNQGCSALRKISSRRAHERQPSQREDEDVRIELPDRKAVNPEEGVLVGQVWGAVDRLPTTLRGIVELHYGRGLSYTEIAEVMELPLGTVKTHLHRARARLRQVLTGGEPAGKSG